MKLVSFLITRKEAGERIDKFLVQQKYDYSRAHLQKLIKGKKILANQKAIKPSYKLKLGDLIEAEIISPEKISLEPDSSIKLDIIYEDNNVIVLNKPAGLIVHPRSHTDIGVEANPTTLVNGLLAYFPAIQSVGENSRPTEPARTDVQSGGQSFGRALRPGIVHRLDKDTSGLMIVAKNNSSFQFLKQQFQQRKVIKKYLALINGCPSKKQGIIEAPIGKAKKNPTKQKISFSLRAKKAITEYKIIKKINSKFCLVEVYPKTGRMHQIRVHFAYLGHPIIGDKKYGGPALAGLNRHFLHATYLKLKLPSGQIKEFRSNLPDNLKKILKTDSISAYE